MNINEIQEYYKNYSNTYNTGSNIDLLNQVGKTYLGKTISLEVFNKIVKSIVENLDIKNTDTLIDLGCANGLVSYNISKKAKFINGFDLSAELINIANKYNITNNISFNNKNILDIDFCNFTSNKIYMYEVLQFFDNTKLKKLIQNIDKAFKKFLFFIGSIPDQEKIFEFYNTKERKKYYFNEILSNNKFHIGNWWYKEQIEFLCEDLGLKCKIIEQDKSLHTAPSSQAKQ